MPPLIIRINLVSFETFICPLFRQICFLVWTFFHVSYSKPALDGHRQRFRCPFFYLLVFLSMPFNKLLWPVGNSSETDRRRLPRRKKDKFAGVSSSLSIDSLIVSILFISFQVRRYSWNFKGLISFVAFQLHLLLQLILHYH